MRVANPKRRWLLATVAILAAAAAVGFLVLREDPKDDVPRMATDDLPRLVMTKQGDEKGQRVEVFRFDAPKRWNARGLQVSTTSPSANGERGVTWGGRPPGLVKAGQSAELTVIAPPDDVWRLRCQVGRADIRALESVQIRVRLCWKNKSLAPLRWGIARSFEMMESELITNAVPPAADAPRP
jgi:hypothetical protein